MDHLLAGVWNYGVIFLLVLTVVVFVHELGHYLVARWNGVKIETFSIGFGPEVMGFTDRSGTRWKFSAVPLGGYVKMLGDASAASTPADVEHLSPQEQSQAFPCKRLWQRASIVAAGPIANFVFGIVVLTGLFMAYGETSIGPVIGSVTEGSAAAEAGLRPQDRVLAANGERVERFQDLQRVIALAIEGPVELKIERDGAEFTVTTHPRITEERDFFGNAQKRPLLGIRSDPGAVERIEHGPVSALVSAGRETRDTIVVTLTAVGQMLTGVRSSDEVSGPIRIAKGAGQAAQVSFASLVLFTVLISINLGLINLFPVPLLDGGHLLFYGVEALIGRPLSAKAQEYGFRLGLFLVFALMLLATRNDLVDLRVWDLIKGIVS